MLFLRFPGFKKKAFTMSYDDAVPQDKRLVALMAERGIKGTFNINSGQLNDPKYSRISSDEVKALYIPNGMEVAVHGLYHSWIDKMTYPEMLHEISEDRKNIEALTGTVTRGMAYAYGAFNENVISAASACGIAYSRTVASTHGFKLPQRPLALNPTCHHNDARLFDLWSTFTAGIPSYDPDAKLFYLWGHSYEFDGSNNWDMIERFLDTAAQHDDIWYATNIEIIDYAAAFKSLVRSYDNTIVFNPTAYRLCFYDTETTKDYEASPGETLRLK